MFTVIFQNQFRITISSCCYTTNYSIYIVLCTINILQRNLRIIKTISWSLNVSIPLSALSHNACSLWINCSHAVSKMLPWSTNSCRLGTLLVVNIGRLSPGSVDDILMVMIVACAVVTYWSVFLLANLQGPEILKIRMVAIMIKTIKLGNRKKHDYFSKTEVWCAKVKWVRTYAIIYF